MRLRLNSKLAQQCSALIGTLLLMAACGDSGSLGADKGGKSSGGSKTKSGSSGSSDGESADGGAADDGTGPSELDDPNRCVSNREFFATQAWPEVVGKVCLQCHGPGGTASQQGSSYVLQPSAYPGFLEFNMASIANEAKREVDGTSVLLLTPSGQLEHQGGTVVPQDSEQYGILAELVTRLNGGEEECPDVAEVASFDDVDILGPVATFRKAALQLNGRLPSPDETQLLLDQGEDALRDTVRQLFNEDAFYERLIEVFNDQWLTDRYLRDSNNVLRDTDFPNLDTYYDGLDDAGKQAARRSVAREPLELMAYIVREDKPFTEIVTADYTVLNPYTAPIYNNDSMQFDDAYNEHELHEGRIRILRQPRNDTDPVEQLDWPHAGILSSPIFLNRYPTSPTNRNRHRARIVLREFLATDILKIADRPIDPTAAVNFANPTREDPSCKTCHAIIDPIAGSFQKWDDNDQEEYLPDREWHSEMFLPGFGDDSMQVSDYPTALTWLGEHIAADPRFPLSVVRNAYKSLTGQAPLEFPSEPGEAGAYLAWANQNSTIRAIADAFVADNFNFKTVVEEIVMSPYYRAQNTSATSETRLDQLSAVGTGQLLTPELLNRKLSAVFGYTWLNRNDPVLTSDMRILYGGIDSESVTERLTTPNGIMSAIIWRMSTEVSCFSVARDFAKDQKDRRLFRNVELDTVPEDDLAQEDPEAKAAIMSNLEYLYALFLGEQLEPDSEEANRIYDLFLSTWREGRSKLSDDRVDTNLPNECQYRRDIGADQDLPDGERLVEDPRYVMRSWMAVVTYLLADYKFTHE